jgi:hypothetical protein
MAMNRLLGLIAAALPVLGAHAYEQAYERTEPGAFEIKSLPAVRAMKAEREGPYFGTENGLFRRLFRYIQANDVAMTTPVETETRTAVMRFFAGKDAPADLPSTNGVTVEALGERIVASAGARGSYTEENVAETTLALRAWLGKQPGWVEDGPPRAAYWNGPFLPGFFKKYEVHIPVRPATPVGPN